MARTSSLWLPQPTPLTGTRRVGATTRKFWRCWSRSDPTIGAYLFGMMWKVGAPPPSERRFVSLSQYLREFGWRGRLRLIVHDLRHRDIGSAWHVLTKRLRDR
jgi:hypothetical protein